MALPERWLTVDPGEDTGWSVWSGTTFVTHGTDKMWEFSDMLWQGRFGEHPEPPDVLVEPTEGEDQYMAGLLDGEGSICVLDRKNVQTPDVRLTINMVTSEPLQWAQARYGGTLRGPVPRKSETQRDTYYWDVNKATEVFSLLDKVYPYLLVKREQANKAFLALQNTGKHFAKRTIPVSLIVCEDWRLYPWELRKGSLDWDECRTARLIGSIYQYARMHDVRIEFQPASIKERALAAGAEAYFSHPLRECRHQNDATMHGTFRVAKENGARWTNLGDKSWIVPSDTPTEAAS